MSHRWCFRCAFRTSTVLVQEWATCSLARWWGDGAHLYIMKTVAVGYHPHPLRHCHALLPSRAAAHIRSSYAATPVPTAQAPRRSHDAPRLPYSVSSMLAAVVVAACLPTALLKSQVSVQGAAALASGCVPSQVSPSSCKCAPGIPRVSTALWRLSSASRLLSSDVLGGSLCNLC